ncbi:MAG: RNase adapter RapZ [Halioglobus sp.]|nr:RNase adapter RapZ [Halioglobus sp.]
MQLIIISGRSGSGKSTAIHQLEDEGFYCIDNLPLSLLPSLADKLQGEDFSAFPGAAVCIDARNSWKDLSQFGAILDALPNGLATRVLYLDARDEILIKRYNETRRRHPLSNEATPLGEAIERERELLAQVSSAATLTLDSSSLTLYELRDAVRQQLLETREGTLSILIQSFGFKHGVPTDADLVYDVRMLPNPHWAPELRKLTGRDAPVQAFLESHEVTTTLLDDIINFLDRWLPHYANNNRSYLTVSIGCTGGQHRSVYLAERLYQRYADQYEQVHLRHRELP